jgi:hypothetical protein
LLPTRQFFDSSRKDLLMVATAAWLTIEPEISLEGFFASEELDSGPVVSPWGSDDWSGEPPDKTASSSSDSRT